MLRMQQSCRLKSVFGAVDVDVEYVVKIQLKFGLTKVHFVGPHCRMLPFFPSTSLATRQPVQPPRWRVASEVATCNPGQRGTRALSDYSADA